MAKENCWFKHDSSAGRGLRLRKIQHIYGHEGKGMYWDVIEVLREQTGYKYSFKETDLQMLASIIGAKDDAKFINFIKDCVNFDLLEVKDNMLFSSVLTRNMKALETKKRNASGIKAKLKRNDGIRLDKNREDKNINTSPDLWDSYLDHLNLTLSKRYKGGEKEKKSFYARINEGRTIEDFKSAVTNASKDPYHITEKYRHLTPEFFTRADKLDKFTQNFSSVATIQVPKKEIEQW